MVNNLFYFPQGQVQGEKHISRNTFRYAFRGYQHYSIEGKDRTLVPDSMLFVNAGQGFDTDTLQGSDVELMTLSINEQFLTTVIRTGRDSTEALLDDPERKVPIPERTAIIQDHGQIEAIMQELKRVVLKKRESADLDLLLGELADLFFHEQGYQKSDSMNRFKAIKKSTRLELDRRMTLAKEYIEGHITRPLDLTALCREVSMSKYHFSRSFKVWMGITPMKYLRGLRIGYAENLLKRSELSITDVSEILCFESPDSFSRAFKRVKGQSPKTVK